MDTTRMFQELAAICPPSEGFRDALLSGMSELSLPKDHYLLQPPQVSDQAYFVQEGFACSFVFAGGVKNVEWFWKKDQCIFSPRSFFEQKPAREFIQLAAQSELLCISYKSIEKLLDEYSEARSIHRVIMNRYFESSRQRTRELQQLNADERFRRLIIHYPTIEQLVSQESIASYLGITPQSLSRIKRRTTGVL